MKRRGQLRILYPWWDIRNWGWTTWYGWHDRKPIYIRGPFMWWYP